MWDLILAETRKEQAHTSTTKPSTITTLGFRPPLHAAILRSTSTSQSCIDIHPGISKLAPL
jgi:hypothetical protein